MPKQHFPVADSEIILYKYTVLNNSSASSTTVRTFSSRTMDIAVNWHCVDLRFLALVPVILLFITYIIPYFADRYGLRRYPGPLLAKVSNMWFANQVLHRRNIAAVHEMHQKYGKSFSKMSRIAHCSPHPGTFVRISPNQVSIADPDALQAIYSYSSGALKGELYGGLSVFANHSSMFSTRARDVHARKRKYLSHVMSLKSIQELEPNILAHQQVLVQRWDGLCAEGSKSKSGTTGSCHWRAHNGRVWFNCQPCK